MYGEVNQEAYEIGTNPTSIILKKSLLLRQMKAVDSKEETENLSIKM